MDEHVFYVLCVLMSYSAFTADLTVNPLVSWRSVFPADAAKTFLCVVKPERRAARHHLSTLRVFQPTPGCPTCLNAAPGLSPPESSLWFPGEHSRRTLQPQQQPFHTTETSPTHQRPLSIRTQLTG